MRMSVEDVPDEDTMMHKSTVQAERAAGDFDRADEWLNKNRGS